LSSALYFLACALCLQLSGCTSNAAEEFDLESLSWDQIEAQARGTNVNLLMWMGDPYINAYMRDYVTPALKERYAITLNIGSGQGNQIVSMLMTELEAGKPQSEIDMMWINGETFYQLRQIQALYGPFTDRLPNARYIDFDNPFIGIDFQQPVAGYEAPWGNVQLTLIYDSTRVTNPPRNREELASWVRANPGQFTFDNGFTGMTFLKSLLIDIAGGPQVLAGSFDEALYAKHSAELWRYLNQVKPYFWKSGETYPNSVAPMHQMFANGEIAFTMSNNDGEVDNKVLQGVLPESARAYVLDSGTIRNSHYLGIPINAPNKAAALVAADFLISPAAQLEKALPAVWGDGTVLSLQSLPEEWKTRFEKIDGRTRVPPRAELERKALPEPASEVMFRLYDDFRSRIIEREQ
jgi:putative spermidine/putrescine transport system substrate-binding protein